MGSCPRTSGRRHVEADVAPGALYSPSPLDSLNASPATLLPVPTEQQKRETAVIARLKCFPGGSRQLTYTPRGAHADTTTSNLGFISTVEYTHFTVSNSNRGYRFPRHKTTDYGTPCSSDCFQAETEAHKPQQTK